VTSLRIIVGDASRYDGPTTNVPAVGDHIRLGDQTLRIESALWDLTPGERIAAVTLVAGDHPYTY
jgi:hypothetical protein